MSKMDQLRALREARYAANAQKGAATTPKRMTPPPTAPPLKLVTADTVAEESAAGDGAEALCGHKSMNGRTCTRDRGHAAKSHRYS